MRDIGGNLARRYAYGFLRSDRRDWYDCTMNAAGNACALDDVGNRIDPYGTTWDGVAQNWEIGTISNTSFGSNSSPTRLPDISAREYNRIWTVGLQQEVFPGISLSGEYRQRTFHNTWWD